MRFARAAGYARIVLWTQSKLAAAHRRYQRAGFERTARKPTTASGTIWLARLGS